MHDALVKSATIVDGTGAAPLTGDVAITAGKITDINQAIWDDGPDPDFSYGVTSVVMGNSGVRFAPPPPGFLRQGAAYDQPR